MTAGPESAADDAAEIYPARPGKSRVNVWPIKGYDRRGAAAR